MDNHDRCNNCGEITKPRIDGNATAVACQNPKCRMVYDSNGNMLGQMSVCEYKGNYPDDSQFKKENV